VLVGWCANHWIRAVVHGVPGAALVGLVISAIAVAVTRKEGALASACLTAVIWFVFGMVLKGAIDPPGS
jgi:hypothetical protein